MALKSKLWMNGCLEWYTYINEEAVYLGTREVPAPLQEGDSWTSDRGDMFRVLDGVILLTGATEPPRKYW